MGEREDVQAWANAEFEDAEIMIRDQALTIEGLSQANTELERQHAQHNQLASNTITSLRSTIHEAVHDVRALRDVPISQLDQCIADIVAKLIEGAS